jgi:hypothetical protein
MVVLRALGALVLAAWVRDARAVTYSIGPAPGTITTTTPVVTVPITLCDFVPPPTPTGNGAKGFQVTVQLTSGLKFAQSLGQSIKPGPFLTGTGPCPNSAGDPSPIFSATLNTNGTVTIVAALNPGKCGQCTTPAFPNGGVVFTLDIGTTLTTGISNSETVSLVAAPAGTPSPTLNDCSANAAIPGLDYGVKIATVPVSLCSPTTAAPTNLSTTQKTSGNSNPSSGLTGIVLSWTNPAGIDPAATLDVWRAPFGYVKAGVWQNAHPEYDDDNLFFAQAPVTPTGTAPVLTTPLTGWTKVGTTPTGAPTTFTDTPPSRGYWYYVVNITDPCNLTQISNMSAGSLDYLLGDVTNGTTVGQGDDVVGSSDVSAFGSAYGAVVPASPGVTANLDIGPTMDRTPTGRPHPDDFIGFEDLIVLSMNYSKGPAPQFARIPAAADRDELTLDVPSRVVAGQTFTAELRMKGAGNLQAVSTHLGWDPAVVEPTSVSAGTLALAQDGLVLSSGPGDVDVAVLGRDRPGLSGEGVIATVDFRSKVSGDPRVGIASVDARDRSNQRVELSSGAPAAPLVSTLAPASPNPFKHSSVFSFSLGKPGSTELAVFSVDGRRVRTLVAGTFEAGSYHVTWDGTNDAHRSVQPGLYYVRLVTAEGRFNRTVVLMN